MYGVLFCVLCTNDLDSAIYIVWAIKMGLAHVRIELDWPLNLWATMKMKIKFLIWAEPINKWACN